MLLNSRVHFDIPKAISYGEQSLAIARSMGLAEQLAYTLNDLSSTYSLSGQVKKGEAASLEARAYWVSTGNMPMLADNYGYAAMSHTALGRFRDAVEDSRTGLEVSRKIRNLWGEAHSQLWVGRAYVNLGEIEEAVRVMQEAMRLAPQSGFVAPLIISRSGLGMLYGEAGQAEKGISLARAALDNMLNPISTATAIATGCAARLAIMNHDWSGAEEYLRTAFKTVEKTALGIGLPIHIFIAEGELELVRGNFAAALEKLSRLSSKLEHLELKQELPLALMLEGESLARLQNLDEAESTLVRAIEIAEECEAHWPLWRILLKRAWVARLRGQPDDARALETRSRAEFEYVLARTPGDLRDSFLAQWEANLSDSVANLRN
jgi:tetratricopeptide (TPR) repeat protein